MIKIPDLMRLKIELGGAFNTDTRYLLFIFCAQQSFTHLLQVVFSDLALGSHCGECNKRLAKDTSICSGNSQVLDDNNWNQFFRTDECCQRSEETL